MYNYFGQKVEPEEHFAKIYMVNVSDILVGSCRLDIKHFQQSDSPWWKAEQPRSDIQCKASLYVILKPRVCCKKLVLNCTTV